MLGYVTCCCDTFRNPVCCQATVAETNRNQGMGWELSSTAFLPPGGNVALDQGRKQVKKSSHPPWVQLCFQSSTARFFPPSHLWKQVHCKTRCLAVVTFDSSTENELSLVSTSCCPQVKSSRRPKHHSSPDENNNCQTQSPLISNLKNGQERRKIRSVQALINNSPLCNTAARQEAEMFDVPNKMISSLYSSRKKSKVNY